MLGQECDNGAGGADLKVTEGGAGGFGRRGGIPAEKGICVEIAEEGIDDFGSYGLCV